MSEVRPRLPLDPPAPINPIFIQVRLNPDVVRKGFVGGFPQSATWVVPPHHLVFGRPSDSAKEAHTDSRRPPIIDVATNMIGVQDAAANKIRCVGVSVDPLVFNSAVTRNPDYYGRFSVAVSGVITVACNRAELVGASVGDTIYYDLDSESDCEFEGLHNHRSLRLTSLGPEDTCAKIIQGGDDAETKVGKLKDLLAEKENLRPLGTLVALSKHHDECRIMLRL